MMITTSEDSKAQFHVPVVVASGIGATVLLALTVVTGDPRVAVTCAAVVAYGSCVLSNLVGLALRLGYTYVSLATWKTVAKAHTFLAGVFTVATTMTSRADEPSALVSVLALSSLSVAASLTADLRVGWADASTRTAPPDS
jgi:hypothetical protein